MTCKSMPYEVQGPAAASLLARKQNADRVEGVLIVCTLKQAALGKLKAVVRKKHAVLNAASSR